MASSRSSARADPGADAVARVEAAVRAALAGIAARIPDRATRVDVALSGGRDSMTLLDAAARVAPALAIALRAVHVHHGLSVNADAWTRFCAQECRRRGVALAVRRVDVDRASREGLEAAARHARYAALADTDADAVALAHHADDQAETLLLQLMRGAGPHGLAAMAPSRAAAGATLVRPLLALPRRDVERYADARALAWVEDESNADRARTRNLVRHDLAPRIAAGFPGYPATLARAAAHQAEAALLIDELAMQDAEGGIAGDTLARERLAALAASAPHRARNLLRWFLRANGLRAPSTARLAAMLDQLVGAAADARVELRHDGAAIGVHRGRIAVHARPAAPFAVAWRGESRLALPHGVLEFASAVGEGLAVHVVHHNVVVRARSGGERLRLAPFGARQTLKHLMQRAGIPHWARRDLPLVFCGDALVAVPGIGVDAAFRAAAGAPGFDVRWHPGAR